MALNIFLFYIAFTTLFNVKFNSLLNKIDDLFNCSYLVLIISL